MHSRFLSSTKYTTELEALSSVFFLVCSVRRAVTGRGLEFEVVVLTDIILN